MVLPSRRFVLPVAGLLLAAASAAAQQPDRRALAARVDSIVAAAMADEHIPGVSVAVLRGRDTIAMRGYGLADVENGVGASPATVYRIGSVTKQFTALMILQLAREGKLSLDDTLQRFVDFPTPGRHVTIRHLLTHTSGIPSYTSIGRDWLDKITLDLSHEQLLALVRDRPADFAPGERFLYDNTGYYLLGMIIERAGGHRYDEELATRITGPLGLRATKYCWTRELLPNRAQGYDDSSGVVVNAKYLSMTQPFAAGALCSTVGDLLVWQAALASDRLLPGGYAQMSTPGRLNNGTATGYGFGLGIGRLGTHRAIAHGGGINGFSTQLSNYPDDSLVVVVLANSESANVSRVATRIARAAFGIPEPAVRDLPISAADRQRFSGSYRLTDALTLRIYASGDSLMSQATGQGSFRLLFQGDREFRASFDTDVRIVFEVDAAGRATTLLLYQGGERRAPRIE